ncbi:flagellar motor protein MotB [Parvibium lacunae]|uniref:Motility protein MotB n=1 Tax=Parvibium lacunae TaxID=1888893 RepID=A0A368L777_9BURK|nr:flagellar motor protein MotB [Parvibium lacunae]RCS59361.1 motility protein MotB [Parvibium lacunae]
MANKDDDKQIVIRRIKKVAGGGHHGGAWKIAYADFVTAMMAFFLLMWLLGSTTKGDLQGIADYFSSPLKVALEGGSGAGDSSSLYQAGGEDLTRQHGQVKRGDVAPKNQMINLQAAKAEMERQERRRMFDLKAKIEGAISNSVELKQLMNQIKMEVTADGLRISIVDEQNRAMFDSGSAVLKDYTKALLREIAQALNSVDNRISLSGHTDATPFASGQRGYSNWELSADRANASRREMIAGGLDENKVLRVVGLASALPLDAEHPNAPVNRRISITILNKKAEEAVANEDRKFDVNESEQRQVSGKSNP